MGNNKISRPDGWISVKDRLPEELPLDRPPVLVWVNSYYQGKGGYDLAIRINGKWITVKGWDLEDSNVDFWTELPQKPNFDEQ